MEDMAASEESDATAVGLAGLLSKYSFVAAVFFYVGDIANIM